MGKSDQTMYYTRKESSLIIDTLCGQNYPYDYSKVSGWTIRKIEHISAFKGEYFLYLCIELFFSGIKRGGALVDISKVNMIIFLSTGHLTGKDSSWQ